jgi:hypothetical protein
VDENGIHGDSEDLTFELGKLPCGSREVEYFRRADKGEIKRVKEEDDPFPFVI